MNDKLTEKEKKAYVSLYKKDSLSYSLTLCAIIAELVFVVGILDVMEVSFWMGITVMVNIAVLFILFTCAVKMNIYNRTWGIVALVLGVYFLVRQFVIVPGVLKPYERQVMLMVANISGAVCLVLAGLVSIKRTNRRRKLQEALNE
jgi:hypothetical protein